MPTSALARASKSLMPSPQYKHDLPRPCIHKQLSIVRHQRLTGIPAFCWWRICSCSAVTRAARSASMPICSCPGALDTGTSFDKVARETFGHPGGQAGGTQTDIWTDRQADRQTGRQTERQTDQHTAGDRRCSNNADSYHYMLMLTIQHVVKAPIRGFLPVYVDVDHSTCGGGSNTRILTSIC